MNHVRVIGGNWKRRNIVFNDVEGLRPTPDRVRETLFNWLMWDIYGKRVLDLCAGSGILGIEALSRGAKDLVFIEPDKKQFQTIRLQLQTLIHSDASSSRTNTVETTTFQGINSIAQKAISQLQNTAPFELLFLDPPYALNLWQTLAEQADNLLTDQALIYVEANKPIDTLNLPTHWQLVKSSKAGQIYFALLQKVAKTNTNKQPVTPAG